MPVKAIWFSICVSFASCAAPLVAGEFVPQTAERLARKGYDVHKSSLMVLLCSEGLPIEDRVSAGVILGHGGEQEAARCLVALLNDPSAGDLVSLVGNALLALDPAYVSQVSSFASRLPEGPSRTGLVHELCVHGDCSNQDYLTRRLPAAGASERQAIAQATAAYISRRWRTDEKTLDALDLLISIGKDPDVRVRSTVASSLIAVSCEHEEIVHLRGAVIEEFLRTRRSSLERIRTWEAWESCRDKAGS